MPSFQQHATAYRPSQPPEAVAAVNAGLDAAATANEARLNQPLTAFRKFLATFHFSLARSRGPAKAACLAPEAVAKANRSFDALFVGRLPQWTGEVLDDPNVYLKKIHAYESDGANRAEVPFHTETANYRLIVKDPLRIQEEHFISNALLKNGLLEEVPFSALDMGTGSGRMAFCMAALLRRFTTPAEFEIYGVDIRSENIRDALEIKAAKGYGAEVKFVNGDIRSIPFRQDRFSFCNAASSTYLVPAHARPLNLLEMVRVLKPDGEGIITGPNEHFSVYQYTCCMGASNLKTYLNPANMIVAHRLGPTGMLIDAASRSRRDFALPDTSEICLALKKAGCDILQVTYWPKSNVTPLFSGIHFRKTAASNRIMARYNTEMQRLIDSRGVSPI